MDKIWVYFTKMYSNYSFFHSASHRVILAGFDTLNYRLKSKRTDTNNNFSVRRWVCRWFFVSKTRSNPLRFTGGRFKIYFQHWENVIATPAQKSFSLVGSPSIFLNNKMVHYWVLHRPARLQPDIRSKQSSRSEFRVSGHEKWKIHVHNSGNSKKQSENSQKTVRKQ